MTSTQADSRTLTGAAGGCTAVVGLQWGDEGKGKIVDLLAKDHDAVVRFNGGANAGHSVVVGGTRYSLHLIPSGILYPGKRAIIGNGVVVDPWKLVEELDGLAQRGVPTDGLVISDRAHVVLPYHKREDALREDLLTRGVGPDPSQAGSSGGAIGTTRRGIGPAYADKCQRAGAVRVRDLTNPALLRERLAMAMAVKGPLLRGLGATQPEPELDEKHLAQTCAQVGERLRPMVRDTTLLLHEMLGQGKRLLFEGANGTLLDVDHGTYPYVTGSTCVISGIGAGTGVPATRLSRVLGVMKAYTTRVGAGPLPTELKDDTGNRIRERGREYGTTTGRPRRVGWLDLVATRYSARINGATGVALTMLDVLSGFDEVRVCTAYQVGSERTDWFTPDASDLSRVTPVFTTLKGWSQDISAARTLADLPAAARAYVDFLESFLGIPADIVSVGPGREQTLAGGGAR